MNAVYFRMDRHRWKDTAEFDPAASADWNRLYHLRVEISDPTRRAHLAPDPQREVHMSAILFLFMGLGFAMSFFILACLGALIRWSPVRND